MFPNKQTGRYPAAPGRVVSVPHPARTETPRIIKFMNYFGAGLLLLQYIHTLHTVPVSSLLRFHWLPRTPRADPLHDPLPPHPPPAARTPRSPPTPIPTPVPTKGQDGFHRPMTGYLCISANALSYCCSDHPVCMRRFTSLYIRAPYALPPLAKLLRTFFFCANNRKARAQRIFRPSHRLSSSFPRSNANKACFRLLHR